jgi:hypothetical protein
MIHREADVERLFARILVDLVSYLTGQLKQRTLNLGKHWSCTDDSKWMASVEGLADIGYSDCSIVCEVSSVVWFAFGWFCRIADIPGFLGRYRVGDVGVVFLSTLRREARYLVREDGSEVV